MSFSRERELNKQRELAIRHRLITAKKKKKKEEIEQYVNEKEDPEHSGNYDTIFVSIPSYRDPECVRTIEDLFRKARYPHRIYVGVCQQNLSVDGDCMDSIVARKFQNNIRVLRLDAKEAKGPIWARHVLISRLFAGEKYLLSIDSHMLFMNNWDTVLINQLASCPSEKAILTCYPPEFDIQDRKRIPKDDPVFLVFLKWYEKYQLPLQERRRFKHKPAYPQPCLFWAAGFNFSKALSILEVPYDPDLRYAFTGEEITMAMRLWTSGWDFFAPSVTAIYHYTSRDYRPTFWENFHRNKARGRISESVIRERKLIEQTSVQRMKDLLEGKLDENDPCGLGKVRSREDFERYVGLGFENAVVESHARTGITPVSDQEERRSKYGFA